MTSELELRERQKMHLASLLRVKKFSGQKIQILQDEILNVVVVMLEEDVALVEKLLDVKAID